MIKIISAGLVALALILTPAIASAHIAVLPDEVRPGEFLTFTVSVPNERDVPVTNVKLLLPTGLKNVKPTVKNGWTVTVDKASIIWSDGTIAKGFRDDFTFSAQAPEKVGELIWKSYETYADGTVAKWDQSPDKEEVEGSNSGPYSVTKVVAEVATGSNSSSAKAYNSNSSTLPIFLSLLAVTVSVASLLFKKRA